MQSITVKYSLEVVAWWLESWTRNPKVASLSLGPAGIVGGWMHNALNTTTEVPLSPQLLCAEQYTVQYAVHMTFYYT